MITRELLNQVVKTCMKKYSQKFRVIQEVILKNISRNPNCGNSSVSSSCTRGNSISSRGSGSSIRSCCSNGNRSTSCGGYLSQNIKLVTILARNTQRSNFIRILFQVIFNKKYGLGNHCSELLVICSKHNICYADEVFSISYFPILNYGHITSIPITTQ